MHTERYPQYRLSIETYKSQTLRSDWHRRGCPPLWPLLTLRPYDSRHSKQIQIWSPTGRTIDNISKSALIINTPSMQKYLTNTVTAELCVADRVTKSIIGTAAKLCGDFDAIVTLLGWGTPPNETDLIGHRLTKLSNDYTLYETIARALGLNNIADDTAPILSSYPSVDIVIPARGVEATINAVVEHIIEAVNHIGLTRWNCIVVDDANDTPLKIKCNTEHVKLIRSNKRVHCGGARNLGIRNGRNDIVTFCDGDTIIADNYFREHIFRQLVSPNIISVSMRESIKDTDSIPSRLPLNSDDTRASTTYFPGRLGLTPVTSPTKVSALSETSNFRTFGYGKKLGPADLPFMVKGNNICTSRSVAEIGFPSSFVGYGPEDGVFAAKAIARGAMIVPVLSTGVFHVDHPPRSGEYKEKELEANLIRQKKSLNQRTWEDWKYVAPFD